MPQSPQVQEFVRLLITCSSSGVLGLIPASIADLKNKNFWKWWLFGALLFIVALPAAILAKAEPDPVQDSETSGIQPESRPGKRPVAISILCIFILIIVVVDMIERSSGPNVARSAIQWELFISAIFMIALIGVWLMRKWGLYLFLYQVLFIDGFFIFFTTHFLKQIAFY